MSDALTALDALGRLTWQASWHAAVLGLLVLISLRFRAVQRRAVARLEEARCGYWSACGSRCPWPPRCRPVFTTSIAVPHGP